MEAAAASTEITVLGWSVVLLLVQIILQAVSIYDLGPYLLGPRDEDRKSGNVMAGRLERALKNLLETYPAFVALALGLAVAGKTGGIAATGAWLWLAARVVYLPLYAFGVPALRTLAWVVSLVGLLLMLARLLS
ncbi:MAG: MAPEG family protein [Rhizobiales bacterium]|nr:MAPEG family protein [Hyphomicrobiales bacterium]